MCFTPAGIADIIMLLPEEMFDRSLFVDTVLDSLKKKLAQIPDSNPEKGHFSMLIPPDPI
jgi:hypothetical protein